MADKNLISAKKVNNDEFYIQLSESMFVLTLG